MGARWSDSENEIMREFYPKEGTEIAERLDGRTKQAIWLQAMRLGLKVEDEIVSRNIGLHINEGNNQYEVWTKEDKRILDENYRNNKANITNLLPNHTASACRSRASLRNLTKAASHWNDEEKKLLMEHLDEPSASLIPLFPGRSRSAIASMQSRLRQK